VTGSSTAVTYDACDRLVDAQTLLAQVPLRTLKGCPLSMYLCMVHRQGERQTSALNAQIADTCWFGADHCCSAVMEAPDGEGSGCLLAWGAPGRPHLDTQRSRIARLKGLMQMQIVPLRQRRPQDGGHAAQAASTVCQIIQTCRAQQEASAPRSTAGRDSNKAGLNAKPVCRD
jgi:hypothetical protein